LPYDGGVASGGAVTRCGGLPFALMVAASAQAVTINDLQASGFGHIYGSYGTGGDCAREPRVMIAGEGMTFRASGRTVTTANIEFAASFFGGSYEGDALAFRPFPRSDSEFGPVLMFVKKSMAPFVSRPRRSLASD
jgi:hypothetical protein